MMATAYIAIGSNLGDRKKNIDDAVRYLGKDPSITVNRISSIYETEPVGGPPQGKFLNGVLEIEAGCSPDELLELLLSIETKLGRVRSVTDGPRTIDLDILIYGDLEINESDLVIPHPRMFVREFVLKGLREIMPGLAEVN